MHKLSNLYVGFSIALVAFLSGCTTDKPKPKPPVVIQEQPKITIPKFNGKNAYDFVQKQVDFGPRVPETEAHSKCAEWLKESFSGFGAETIIQEARVDGFDGKKMNIKNIIASYNPDASKRILLCAHWDTRRVADQDTERIQEPILGADDGGSGVAVLLEIARVLSENPIKIGVDIVLFDAEDQGESSTPTKPYRKETWCIGSQYWSKTPHKLGYKANFGILLDMVGSKGARFPKEGLSMKHAGIFVEKVWTEALNMGYSDLFVSNTAQQIVDDHLFINEIANIPTLDIINLPTNPGANGSFGHYWHTHKDNMDVIDQSTLNAVGNVLTHILYKESAGIL